MATLRYRNARDHADQLGQVLTPRLIARLLAESLSVSGIPVPRVLDLGAGKGALTLAALEYLPEAAALLVEIDAGFVTHLHELKHPQMTVLHGDALTSNVGGYAPDVILSNPPYGALPLTPTLSEMLGISGLDVPVSGQWVRGDVAFAARAWGLAKRGCQLGLIVASPLVRDSLYKEVRQRMVGELGGLIVTNLPPNTFAGAEVQAFLISGQRKVNRRRHVLLRKANMSGVVIDEMEVTNAASIVSLDIDYHRTLDRLGLSTTSQRVRQTLGSIGVKVSRGSRSASQFEQMGLSAFHTTDFPGALTDVILSGASGAYNTARAGDILIPRVGTRCLGKQARVLHGEGLFTDCIYRLTPPLRKRPLVWKALSSAFGVEWRLANAKGSCAKHLTIQTLMSMPLIT